MPNINEFLKKSGKEHSKSGDWDLSSTTIQINTPTRPQRRPGRGEDSPNLTTLNDQSTALPVIDQEKQTGNKVATKWQQTGNKVATKLATNRQQSGNKTSNKEEVRKETGNKVGTQPATLSATKWQQTDNKPTTKAFFSSLVGLQRAIMIFLYAACKTARGKATDALTLEHIAYYLKTGSGSIKTTLQRLEDKACISRVAFKNGRGGWSKYELPEPIFREMLQLETENKLATNWQQTDNKVGTQPATQPATSLPSSSSLNVLEDFKTTTTDETKMIGNSPTQLEKEWFEIDFSTLAEIHFGQAQLFQIAQLRKLTPLVVQDSINAFAFDLKKNNKGKELKTAPLNFFMGILRRGMPYSPPENYESPEDEARRKYFESKRAQLAKRQAMENEIVELEFLEWKSTLSITQRKELTPHAKIDGSEMQNSTLREYFLNQVYPHQKTVSVEAIRKQIDQALGVIGAIEGVISQ